MIKRVNKMRRQEEAGRMTVTVCGAQVNSLKKTVRFIRPYIQQAYLIHGLCADSHTLVRGCGALRSRDYPMRKEHEMAPLSSGVIVIT